MNWARQGLLIFSFMCFFELALGKEVKLVLDFETMGGCLGCSPSHTIFYSNGLVRYERPPDVRHDYKGTCHEKMIPLAEIQLLQKVMEEVDLKKWRSIAGEDLNVLSSIDIGYFRFIFLDSDNTRTAIARLGGDDPPYRRLRSLVSSMARDLLELGIRGGHYCVQ